jgi:histidyl-tRNA synthetase
MAVNASIPKGTRDFLPRDVWRREHVIGVIRKVYEAHGFEPLETPAIENIETLTGKYGEEGDQLLFKILKRGAKAGSGECDLGLRYDLTVPLARVVAMHQNSLPRFIKRYQIQPVWRADRPARGRFREFYQCDVDIVGSASALVEVDLLSALGEVFDALGFANATIKLNDRRILRGLVEVSGVPLEKELDAVTAIDKLDKIGADGVRAEFLKRGIEADAGAALLVLLQRLAGLSRQDVLEQMAAAFEGKRDALAGVESLRLIIDGLNAAGLGAVSAQVDPYLARGMSYYTGAIFEVTTPDLGGSLGGGGRYDKLIGMFKGQDVPACGASLGLERILLVMDERGMFPAHKGGGDVMIAYFSPEVVGATLGLGAALRRAGLRVDLYPQKDKLGKQFEYANSRGVRFVAVIGPDEQASGQVKLKDMISGAQATMPQAEAAAYLLASL